MRDSMTLNNNMKEAKLGALSQRLKDPDSFHSSFSVASRVSLVVPCQSVTEIHRCVFFSFQATPIWVPTLHICLTAISCHSAPALTRC